MAAPRPLSFHDSGRASPFRRQNSASPATVRATTPSTSPTKATPQWSPNKGGSLSPEKTSPFVRRPSQISLQISQNSPRPSSPFARPSSSLSIPASPSRQVSNASSHSTHEDEAPPSPRPLPSPTRRVSPPSAVEEPDTPTPPPPPATKRDISSPSPFDGSTDSRPLPIPTQANLRPSATRTVTSSTISTVKAPIFNPTPAAAPLRPAQTAPRLNNAVGGYNHVPQPLLRSMRESFEVLDSDNSGTVTAAAVASMLEQMGMDSGPSSLRDFFPPNALAQLNLARYLDMLSAPLADLSHPDELSAAFEAFDVDDSGQIDLAQLRNAVLNTAPEPGEDMVRLSEREVDGILGEFASRRAFGAKGVNVAKGKGEVFRYRDFMAGIAGGSVDAGGPTVEGAMVA